MKPPVTIEKLNEEWDNDIIETHEPDLQLEMLRIPSLHSKYSHIRSHHKLVSYALEEKYRNMKELRREWIEGKSEQETLEKYKWHQFQEKAIITRTQQESRLADDPVLTEILLKKRLQDLIVEQCDSYIKEINNRGFYLRGVIDFKKFLQGHN